MIHTIANETTTNRACRNISEVGVAPRCSVMAESPIELYTATSEMMVSIIYTVHITISPFSMLFRFIFVRCFVVSSGYLRGFFVVTS